MAGRLTKKLQQAVRKLGYRTTVDQLKRRGIERVNVVGIDRIVSLIEAAVHRTLKQRMESFGGIQNRGKIASETRAEFLRLLQNRRHLDVAEHEATREFEVLESEVTRLRRKLAEARDALHGNTGSIEEEVARRSKAEESELSAEITSLIEDASLAGSAGREQLLEAVVRRVQERFAVERSRVVDARHRERESEIALLNRRVEKLMGALEEAQGELSQVRSAADDEPGIASIYRDVQGLAEDENEYEHKLGLMSTIFEQNRHLHDEVAALGGSDA